MLSVSKAALTRRIAKVEIIGSPGFKKSFRIRWINAKIKM